MPSLLHPWVKTLVPTTYEAGLAPELVWTFWRGQKSLVPARIPIPDHHTHYNLSVPYTYGVMSCLVNKEKII
jgi:hypothetical protein